MFRLVGVAVSIGLADSLNPSTIAPALYLASGPRARRNVIQFTIAVFVVYLLGGVFITLGPGHLLISLLPHPHPRLRHILELAAGVAMLVAAALLWRNRSSLGKRELPQFDPQGKSSWVLGASITAVELPTAFPYFAVIAAVVGSDLGVPRQLFLLVLFNVCFVLPLLGIIGTLMFAGDRAGKLLGRGRRFLERYWPQVLAGAALLAGLFVVLLGATGLASTGHGRFGRFVRRFRRIIHP